MGVRGERVLWLKILIKYVNLVKLVVGFCAGSFLYMGCNDKTEVAKKIK